MYKYKKPFKSSDISLTWKSHIISKPFPPGGAILVAKVVPESCQRTDGIDAWLEIKTDKETKRMEKESRQRDKKEIWKVLFDLGHELRSIDLPSWHQMYFHHHDLKLTLQYLKRKF